MRQKFHAMFSPPRAGGRRNGGRFRRTLDYYRLKVMRLGGSPHAVAAGLSIGVLTAWTPLLGLHILIAIPLAYLLGGSVVAAALGTVLANPLTFPIIWPLTWEVGQIILGGEPSSRHIDLDALFAHLDIAQLWRPILLPMLVGSLPLGLLCALPFYAATYLGVRGFRNRRLNRLTQRVKVLKSGEGN